MSEKRVQALMLFDGYGESASLAGVPAWCQHSFESVEEALCDLASAIVEAELVDSELRLGTCCKQVKDAHPDYRCCFTCGKRLNIDMLDADSGFALFYNFLRGTSDSTAFAWDHLEMAGWKVGELTPVLESDIMAVVTEYASELLWYASQRQLSTNDRVDRDAPYGSMLESHCEIGFRKGTEPTDVPLLRSKD